MTSDHSPPRCLRCPDTALRLIDRGAFAVSRDAAPLPAAIRDSALTVEVWVCPICRRIELRYPEELPLPEPPEELLPPLSGAGVVTRGVWRRVVEAA